MSSSIHEVNKVAISAKAVDDISGINLKRLLLDVYTDSEINVKQIEFKVGTATEARTVAFAVCPLGFLAHSYAENAERNVERHIIHDEHAEARTEIQRRRRSRGMGAFGFVVIQTVEIRRRMTQAEIDFIENRETFFSR